MTLTDQAPPNIKLSLAALNMAGAVIFGAFGAHALEKVATAQQLAWWHTATDYFFYHALGLLFIATLSWQRQLKLNLSFVAMQLGIIVFSGSLYALALGAPKVWAMATPVGGSLFILAWLSLAWQAFRFSKV